MCPSGVASVTKNPRDALELPMRRPAPSPTSAGLKAYSSGSGRKYGSGEFLEPRGHLTNDLEPLTLHTRPGWRRPRWGVSKLDSFLEVSRNLLNPTDHPGPVAPLDLRLSSTPALKTGPVQAGSAPSSPRDVCPSASRSGRSAPTGRPTA